jgi:ribosomal protein S27AE
MKNTGVCPKCGWTEIIKIRGGAFNVIVTGLFSSVVLTRYVCGQCGFVEHWVPQDGIDLLRKKFGSHNQKSLTAISS